MATHVMRQKLVVEALCVVLQNAVGVEHWQLIVKAGASLSSIPIVASCDRRLASAGRRRRSP